MAQPVTESELRAEVTAMAVEDGEFRARLLDNPIAAIEESLGLTMPTDLTLTVLEETRSDFYLVLPPRDRLTEGELAGIAGGAKSGW